MSGGAQVDWFAQNAPPTAGTPPPASGGDWFSANAPSQQTIGPQPKSSTLGVLGEVSRIPSDFLGVVGDALDTVTNEIENYDQQGRAEHPILANIGDVTRNAKELLFGGQAAGKPMGTSSGVVNNPVTATMSLADVAPQAAVLAQRKLVQAVDAVKAARQAKNANTSAEVVNSARQLYQRAVAPGGVKVGEETGFQESFNRAAKHIGQYTKAAPIEEGAGGALQSSHTARLAAQNLWDETVSPIIDNFAGVQRPTADVADSIRSSFSALDKQTRPAIVRAGEKFASTFDKPMTVRQMSDLVTQLNSDKSVARFYEMDEAARAQAERADPSLRAKVEGLKALREKLFDTIAEVGGESLGAKFEEARRDFGALSDVEERIRNVKTPTPQPTYKKVANTIKGAVNLKSPMGAAQSAETLLDLENPNRLIPKAFNKLGEVAERPEAVGRYEAVTPANRQLPPPGETGVGGSNPATGYPAPGGPQTSPRIFEVPESMTEGGKLARVPEKSYQTLTPTPAGPRQPEPPATRVGLKEPASTLPGADQKAALRGKWQAILDDPLATASDKQIARDRLKTLK